MFVLDIDESSSHFIHLRFPLKATQPQAAKPNHLSLFFIFTTGNPSNPHANVQDFLCSLVPVGLAWLRSLHLIMERKLKRKHRAIHHHHCLIIVFVIVINSNFDWRSSLPFVSASSPRASLNEWRKVFQNPYRIPNGMLHNPQKLMQKENNEVCYVFIKIDWGIRVSCSLRWSADWVVLCIYCRSNHYSFLSLSHFT